MINIAAHRGPKPTPSNPDLDAILDDYTEAQRVHSSCETGSQESDLAMVKVLLLQKEINHWVIIGDEWVRRDELVRRY